MVNEQFKETSWTNQYADRIEADCDKFYGFIKKPDGSTGIFDGQFARVKTIINLYRGQSTSWVQSCRS